MSDSDYNLYYLFTSSSEFINLCQFQLSLWGQESKADWSAVYLTQETLPQHNPTLIPIAIYPPPSVSSNNDGLLLSSQTTKNNQSVGALLLKNSGSTIKQLILEGFDDVNTHQVVLPLIYQEQVLGLFITRRLQKEWQSEEIGQGEKVAQTLAIACILDQRQQKIQQQLQYQQQQQQWSSHQIDNLLHQLRNPLTAIRTFSKVLLRRLSTDEKSITSVEGVIRESDRLQDLLSTFEADWKGNKGEIIQGQPSLPSAISRPLLVSAKLPLEAVDLREILDTLITSASVIALEKNIKLTKTLGEKKILIKGNTQALREVFTNLLDNAIKYTPNGGKIKVMLLTDKEAELGIAIADTGYGIPQEDIHHIFERSYRGVQEKGTIPGTGLGLSIVKEFIEQMGGTIDCISPNNLTEEKKGTTFQVWLIKA
ncbi:MAG: sensor histidine kinase [Microcystaceae cyanobacterium]